MPSLGRRSPLGADRHYAVSWSVEGLSIREKLFSGKLLLRGKIEQDAAERFAAVLGDALPSAPGELQGTDPRVLWLAPSRWLVLIAADKVTPLHAALVAATAGTHVAVSDISDGRVEIEVSGSLAAQLLAAGTTIDLHPRAFPVTRAAQTQLARVGALIYHSHPDAFGVIVDASVGIYAWEWLTQTGTRVVAAQVSG